MKLGPLVVFDLDLKIESLVYIANKLGLLHHLIVIRPLGNSADIIMANAGRAGMNKEPFLAFQKDINVFCNGMDPQTGKFRANFNYGHLLEGIEPKPAAPGAIFIDGLTKFQDIALEFILGTLGHELNAKGTNSQDDYGRQMGKIMEAIQTVKTIPCITGWTAHEQQLQDQVGALTILPLVTGKKLPHALAKEFNCTLYSTSIRASAGEMPKHVWQVMPDGKVQIAGRTGWEPPSVYVDQDYDKLFG